MKADKWKQTNKISKCSSKPKSKFWQRWIIENLPTFYYLSNTHAKFIMINVTYILFTCQILLYSLREITYKLTCPKKMQNFIMMNKRRNYLYCISSK